MRRPRNELILVGAVLAVLAFCVIWFTVTGNGGAAVGGAVLLLVGVGVLIIWPDKMSLSGGGVAASMERHQREGLEDTVRETLESLHHPEDVTDPVGMSDELTLELTPRAVERGIGSTISRDALKQYSEALISEAAEWGWSLAQMGFTTPPRPQIEWDGDQPRIAAGVGDPSGVRGGPLSGTERPGYDLDEGPVSNP